MIKYACSSCRDTGSISVRGNGVVGGWVQVPCQDCEKGGRLMWVFDEWQGAREVRAVERYPGYWTFRQNGPICYPTAREAIEEAIRQTERTIDLGQRRLARLTGMLEGCEHG